MKKSSKGSSSTGSTTSTISTLGMQQIVERLKSQQHRDTTRKNYSGIWKLFNSFYLRLDIKPKNWEDRILLFTAYLVETKKQLSTVRSYISAIKAILQEDGRELDTDKFLLSSLTKACKLKNDKIQTRFPIYKGLLSILLTEIQKMYLTKNQPYLALL